MWPFWSNAPARRSRYELPTTVRACRRRSAPISSGAQPRSLNGSNGLGLAIARELAERNGGTLQLVASARGTTFTLELTGLATMPAEERGALRSLGQRVAQR